MKRILILLLLLASSAVFLQADAISETLTQIAALKKEISQNSILVEQEIKGLKTTNPLFAEQDPFESDMEYIGRMSQAMPQLEQLRKQYLGNLWQKMSVLRARLFETDKIVVIFDSKNYDPNTEEWKVIVDHLNYQKEHYEITLKIAKTDASNLFKNVDKLQKIGILSVDIGDKIGLAKLKIINPVNDFVFEHEFEPLKIIEHDGYLYSLAFSPDGKFLATGASHDYDHGVVRMINLETGFEVKSFKHYYSVKSLAFSPDGKFIATGSGNYRGGARIFDLVTGIETKSFKHDSGINSLAFSPDGKFLATASEDDNTRIFNLETEKEVKSFKHDNDINSLAFSPDGKFLATGSYYKARIFDLATGNEIKSFEHSYNVNSVTFSPDGNFLATGGNNDSYSRRESNVNAHIFDLETDKEFKSFSLNGNVTSVAFSPNGDFLAIGTNSKRNDYYDDDDAKNDYSNAFIINLKTNEVKSFNHYENVNSVAFGPDGKLFAMGGSDKKAYLYRTLFPVEEEEIIEEVIVEEEVIIEEEVIVEKIIFQGPFLIATVNFTEPSGNRFLDAMEEGIFKIAITNDGSEAGKGIIIRIEPEKVTNLKYKNAYIEQIEPGESVTVEIPIEAYIAVENKTHTFRFNFEEANNFSPSPVEIRFSTKDYIEQ